MSTAPFQRARSAHAKQTREREILRVARDLATRDGVRAVTLTAVAAEVGLHKSALLRYFETREQILLLLATEEWAAWSAEVRLRLDRVTADTAAEVARPIVESLVERPLFCDLLAHVPLSLERHVSVDSVRSYKLGTGREVDAVAGALVAGWPGLDHEGAVDLIASATSLAGAFWQMATPSAVIGELYRTDPQLTHAVVDVGPRLLRILTAYLLGVAAGEPLASGAAPAHG